MSALKVSDPNKTPNASCKNFQFSASLPDRSLLVAFDCRVLKAPQGSTLENMQHPWRTARTRNIVRECENFLAAPIPFMPSGDRVYIISAKKFADLTNIEGILESYGFKVLSRLSHISDSIMQSVLQFTILARISPLWNDVGLGYLIYGPYFLMNSSAVPALKFDILVSGNNLRIVLCPLKMKIPHLQITDLEIHVSKVVDFAYKRIDSVPASQIDLEWVFTLPSLRQAKVISISHTIPSSSPLKTYKDFHQMWFEVHGFFLPMPDKDNPNCSPAGPYITVQYGDNSSVKYTFPSLCVRSSPPTFYRNVDQHVVLGNFLLNFKQCFTTVCEFPLDLKNTLSSKFLAAYTATEPNKKSDNEIDEIVSTLRMKQAISGQQALTMAQQSVAADKACVQLKGRPCSAPAGISDEAYPLQPFEEVALHHSMDAQSSTPLNSYASNNLVIASPPQGDPLSAGSPFLYMSGGSSLPSQQDAAHENHGAYPTSAFFASSVAMPQPSTPNVRGLLHPPAAIKPSDIGAFAVAPKKKPTEHVSNGEMSLLVHEHKVSSLKLPALKDWMARNGVRVGSKAKKEDMVQAIVSYFQQGDP